ncbi:MAG: glycosyltransferase family 39 protein [Candidatus Falkowbacteria bacterium]
MLTKIGQFLKRNALLIFIVVMGITYRSYGIYFDFPAGINAIWDETYGMAYLIDLFHYKNIFLAKGSYPIFLPIIYAPVLALRLLYLMLINDLNSVKDLYDFLIVNGMGHVYIVGRWFAIFFGAVTILLVYKTAKFIFKNRVSGYLAAAAYAVSPALVAMAHWGKVHTAMVFFILLSQYFALIYEENKKIKFFYLSVLASALSIGVHQLGVTSIIFPLAALAFNWRKLNIKIIGKSFMIALFAILFFYLPNIKGLENMFVRDTGRIADNGFLGMYPTHGFERFTYIWHDSFSVESIFVILFIVIMLFQGRMLWKNMLTRYILIGLAFNYFLMSTVFAAPSVIRMMLTFLTLVIILSAGYFASFIYRLSINKKIILFIFFIMLLPDIYFSYKWNRMLDAYTRNETVEWLKENLKSDENVYSFDLYIDAPFSYEAAKWQIEKNGLTDSKKVNYILAHKEEYREKGVNLMYDMGFKRLEELAGENTKYLVFAYWESGEREKRYDIPTKEGINKVIGEVEKHHELRLAKTFYPTDNKSLIQSGVDDYLNNPINLLPLIYLDKCGPTVEVYEVIN